MKKALNLIGLLRWVIPILMLLVGRFVPALQQPVGLPIPPSVYPALMVEMVVGLLWILSEITTVTDRDTPVHALQRDAALSLTLAIAITFIGAWYWAQSQLQWWLIIPWFVTLLDAYLSGYYAINNAAQKPLIQQQRP